MAEDEIIKHTKKVYTIWKNPHTGWQHKLKEIVIEILIIVFAVSLSIWLHNWSEQRHEHALEKNFLTGLKEDLQNDITEMKGDISSYNTSLYAIAYFNRVIQGEPLNNDSAKKYNWTFYNTTQLVPDNSRFEGLKASGQLPIIENKSLLDNILTLYQTDIPNLLNLNRVYNEGKTNRLVTYLDGHLINTKNGTTNLETVLRQPYLQNLFGRSESPVHEILDQYDTVMVHSQKLITQIDKELK